MKTAIIDTTPKDMRDKGSINLGFEIIKEEFQADHYRWYDKLNRYYDIILFNVYYPTNLLNIVPFLRLNKIEPLKIKRKFVKLFAGGQGIGINGILSEIVNESYVGEYDIYNNYDGVYTKPFFTRSDGYNKGIIELTRGCKYKCKFCEYSHVHFKKYKEKPIKLVQEQLQFLRKKGITNINFLSANFSGYSMIDKLLRYADANGITILNNDYCIQDIMRVKHHFNHLPKNVKIGIESFDELTRMKAGKNYTNNYLEEVIDELLKHVNSLHFYLIYGLPNDDYSKWFHWVNKLIEKRRKYRLFSKDLFGADRYINTKSIKYIFSITNFEPAPGTPYASADPVDFKKKHQFIRQWVKCLKDNKYHQPKFLNGLPVEDWYKKLHGRIGRKEASYKMLMELKTAGSEATDKLLYVLPKGIRRSIKEEEAYTFLNWGK